MQKRSKSVKPDDKQIMAVTSSDLRFAFQNFEKRDKYKNVHRRASLDPMIDRNQKEALRGNLTINEGSEAVIHHSSNIDTYEPHTTAQFIENAIMEMISKERLDAKHIAEHTKALNYPSKPLGLVIDNEELKERNLSTIKHSDSKLTNRSSKSLFDSNSGIPPQVMEEWINHTLKQGDDEAAVHPTDKMPRKFKTKHTQKYTHLM